MLDNRLLDLVAVRRDRNGRRSQSGPSDWSKQCLLYEAGQYYWPLPRTSVACKRISWARSETKPFVSVSSNLRRVAALVQRLSRLWRPDVVEWKGTALEHLAFRRDSEKGSGPFPGGVPLQQGLCNH